MAGGVHFRTLRADFAESLHEHFECDTQCFRRFGVFFLLKKSFANAELLLGAGRCPRGAASDG